MTTIHEYRKYEGMNNPARHIVKLCGRKNVAEWADVSEKQTYAWSYPKERGGCDGIIPSKYIPAIAEGARELGHKLTLSDFFPGISL